MFFQWYSVFVLSLQLLVQLVHAKATIAARPARPSVTSTSVYGVSSDGINALSDDERSARIAAVNKHLDWEAHNGLDPIDIPLEVGSMTIP